MSFIEKVVCGFKELIREADQPVGVCREVQARSPEGFLGLQRCISQRSFHPVISHVAHIVENATIEVGRNRKDRKSTRLNSSHVAISYAVFCLKKKKEVKFINKFVMNTDN